MNNIESTDMSGVTYRGTTNSDSKDLSKVLIGALAGAATGSLIAGLFTQKGIEIRNRVGEGSKNIANNIKDKASDIGHDIADKFEATKEGAANLIEKGKQKVGISPKSTDYTANTAYSSSFDTDEDGQGSKILLGALIVSVAGALVWSFATEKGNETRSRLARGSKDIANNLKGKVSDAAGSIASGIADTYETAKEGAVDLLEQKANISTGNTSYGGTTGSNNW
jgi:gas vesicle protein